METLLKAYMVLTRYVLRCSRFGEPVLPEVFGLLAKIESVYDKRTGKDVLGRPIEIDQEPTGEDQGSTNSGRAVLSYQGAKLTFH